MSDGGYSRIEKDFLGNERMVHYDGSGNMIGASDVVREPDGTIRIPNESTSHVSDLPDVRVVEPAPKPEPAAHIPAAAGSVAPQKSQMPLSQTITYVIGTFVAAMLLTIGVLAFRASRVGGSDSAVVPFRSNSTAIPDSGTVPERTPDRTPDEFPSDPKPRNDEDPNNAKPYDQTAPDMNSGDDNHPKIAPNDTDPTPPQDSDKPKNDDKKGGSNDPIDLRGDDDPKKGPPKTDPNDIH